MRVNETILNPFKQEIFDLMRLRFGDEFDAQKFIVKLEVEGRETAAPSASVGFLETFQLFEEPLSRRFLSSLGGRNTYICQHDFDFARDWIRYLNARPFEEGRSNYAFKIERFFNSNMVSAMLRHAQSKLRDLGVVAVDWNELKYGSRVYLAGDYDVHASCDSVLYFKNDQDVMRLRPTVQKFSRFLCERYSSDEGYTDRDREHQLMRFRAKYCATYKLRTENDPAKIREVYEHAHRHGFDSCMTHPSYAYGLPPHLHPALIYGGDSDFELAYLTLGDSDKPMARAIVRKDTREFFRVYPANDIGDKLKGLLANAGYRENVAMAIGGRLNACMHNGAVMAAYIDGGSPQQYEPVGGELSACRRFLKVTAGRSATVSLKETSNLLECVLWQCASCGGNFTDSDDSYHSADGDICGDCLDHYTACDDCGDRVDESQIHTIGDAAICDSCIQSSRYFRCDKCGETFSRNDESEISGTCAGCFQDRYSPCHACDETTPTDDLHQTDDGAMICLSCVDASGARPSPTVTDESQLEIAI